MSTQPVAREDHTFRKIRYEISASNGAVNLSLRKGDEELSVSTDTRGALLLVSDLLTAIDATTNGDAADSDRSPR